MSVVFDDHLLRDVLSGDVSRDLARSLTGTGHATTNLYLYRLSRSVVAAAGGALTGSWSHEERTALGRRLVNLPDEIAVVPMRELTLRMAEIASAYRVSTLGAEAVAAAEHLGASLCVWEGDDGPGIRAAAKAVSVAYRTVTR
ncbi:MAG: hypothetical protein ABWY80_03095 [Acidimicrobiia bacterium]